MATTTLPGVPVDDTLTVWWVPGGVADPASPKVAELTAATSVDISCYLTTKTFGRSEQLRLGAVLRVIGVRKLTARIAGKPKECFRLLDPVAFKTRPGIGTRTNCRASAAGNDEYSVLKARRIAAICGAAPG